MRCRYISIALFVTAAVALASPAMATNIVLNPGFESGDFSFWVANGWSVDAASGSGVQPHSGNFYAASGCIGGGCIAANPDPNGAWLYQDLATVPGENYTLSFWYAPGPGDEPGSAAEELQVLWGAASVPLIASPAGSGCTLGTNCVFDVLGGDTNAYALYTISNLLATSSLTRLEFLGRQDPSFNGVDDVTVESAVPEPASLILVGTGALALFRRRLSSR